MGDKFRYFQDRDSLLTALLGSNVLEVLGRFGSMHALHWRIHDNDTSFDTEWWEQQIVERLPSQLQYKVSVDVFLGT